jgi:hypothetical protein
MAPGTSPGKSIVLLAAAVALVCVALLVLFGRPPAAPPPGPPEEAAPAAVAEPESEPAAPSDEAPAASAPAAPATPAPRAQPAAPEPGPVAEAAPDEGSAPLLPSGIGLFPPPGTDPIKVGIVVPDDFELPEGFLRHYQVTDDGQELEPILLFHPDYELLDDAGQPIPLPPDRVVPPELAPPGMPIRMVAVPEPRPEDHP